MTRGRVEKLQKELEDLERQSQPLRDAVEGSMIITDKDPIFVSQGKVSMGETAEAEAQSVKGEGFPRLSEGQAIERIDDAARQNLRQLEASMNKARSDSEQFFKLTLL